MFYDKLSELLDACESNEFKYANTNKAHDVLLRCPRIRIADPEAVISRFDKDDFKSFTSTYTLKHLPFTAFTISLAEMHFMVVRENGYEMTTDDGCPDFFLSYVQVTPDLLRHGEHASFISPTVALFETITNKIDFACELPREEMTDELIEYLGLGRNAIITGLAIAMYSATNATLIETPDKLQKKRAKHGKHPSFEYYVLNVDAAAIAQVPAEQRFKIVNRLPPRAHKRRGHWRRLGKIKIPVQACDVASKNELKFGRIAKDYSFTP